MICIRNKYLWQTIRITMQLCLSRWSSNADVRSLAKHTKSNTIKRDTSDNDGDDGDGNGNARATEDK